MQAQPPAWHLNSLTSCHACRHRGNLTPFGQLPACAFHYNPSWVLLDLICHDAPPFSEFGGRSNWKGGAKSTLITTLCMQ